MQKYFNKNFNMEEIFDRIELQIVSSSLSKNAISRTLGVTAQGLQAMLKNKSLTLVNFLNLATILEQNPCALINPLTKEFAQTGTGKPITKLAEPQLAYKSDFVSIQTAQHNEIRYLQDKVRLLEQLVDSYKKQLDKLENFSN